MIKNILYLLRAIQTNITQYIKPISKITHRFSAVFFNLNRFLFMFPLACFMRPTKRNRQQPKNAGKSRLKFEYYKIVLRDELGGINKVLRALRHLRNQHKGNAIIAANVTYFTNNQHRMKYAEAKNNNYPIGSGIVEASCKTLVGQRLKRSGMSWQRNGGQGVLTFRSLIKSQRFKKA